MSSLGLLLEPMFAAVHAGKSVESAWLLAEESEVGLIG